MKTILKSTDIVSFGEDLMVAGGQARIHLISDT